MVGLMSQSATSAEHRNLVQYSVRLTADARVLLQRSQLDVVR
jgi:hypothetical protein